MVIGIDASRANQSDKTGTEWYSWHLIRHLAPLLAKHHVRLYARENLEPALADLGAHVEARILSWPPGILWTHLRLSWELLWHRPDVLLILADTVPLIHPARTYTTIHDISFERWPELYGQQSIQRRLTWLKPLVNLAVRIVTGGRYGANELDYHRWSVRHAIKSSRKIFCVSKFTKNELINLLAAEPDRLMVAYQGVIQPDQVELEIVPTEDLAALDLPAKYFIFNGRLERKKNLMTLVKSFGVYRQGGGQAGLVLVGTPGVGWPAVETWLTDHPKVRAGIKILPWQSPGRLWRLFRLALAYVYISPAEGFGRPPLEAYSCGLGVIAARSGSLPEILGDCPIYVEPTDSAGLAAAMEQADMNQSKLRESIVCGQRLVGRYTWHQTASTVATTILTGLAKDG